MNNIDKTNSSEELWLEYEQIREGLSLVLEKLRTILSSINNSADSPEIDFTSLISQVEDIVENQGSLIFSEISSQTSSLQSEIASQTTTLQGNITSQTNTLQNDLASQTSTLQGLLSILSQAVATNETNISSNGAQIAAIQQNIGAMQTTLASMESNLLDAIDSLSSADEVSPFILDFDTIYATRSTCRVWRSYYSNSTLVSTLPEPFIANNQSPALILATFDFYIAQDADVLFTIYLNGVQIDTFTQHMLTGSTIVQRQVAFMTTQSNNEIIISASTQTSCAKVIRDLVYTVAANNALLLHEMPETIYACWPVSTDVYITERTPHFCAYKVISLQNIDHSGAYATMYSTTLEDYYVYPIIVHYCPTTTSSFNQYAYGVLDTTANSLVLYGSDNVAQKTIDINYNSTYAPRYMNIMPYCDATYNTQILLTYPQEPRARRLRTYNTVRSFNSVQNFSNVSVPVQIVSNVVCTIKNGSSSGINDYVVYQDKTGMWYVNTAPRLASNKAGLALGFGTRANLALCPPLAQNTVEGRIYLRAFICAYGTWYAYYIDYDKTNTVFTLQKTEIVQGDFDQVLAGNGNVYFGVKNGGFTTFYDSFYKSITEF